MIMGIGACIGINEKSNIRTIRCYYNGEKLGSILYKYFNSESKVRDWRKIKNITITLLCKLVNIIHIKHMI